MALVQLTKDNFDIYVSENDIVVLDFWAAWCGPCQSFEPIFTQVSEQYPDVIFAKIDIEDQPQLAQDFSVKQIPMIMVLRQHIAVFSGSGTMPASALSDLVLQAKALDMDKVRADLEAG